MNLTLAVLAGLALLLPGLVAIAAWNLRASRSGASRPELPLTAVSILVAAIGVSLVAHLMAWLSTDIALRLASQIGSGIKGALPPTLLQALYPRGLPVIWQNPFDAMLSMTEGGKATTSDLVHSGLLITLECFIVMNVVSHDGFELGLDGFDIGNQGWIYQHIVRPSRNGYRPIAHVLTTTQVSGFGVGYCGAVADIRQRDRGETLVISLLEPERFLFDVRQDEVAGEDRAPAFEKHCIEYIGGVVSVDAKIIANVVIQNVLADLVDEIGEEPGPDQPLAGVKSDV